MTPTRATIDLPERYRPLRHIANGGMAAVWAAEDTVLGREVAIKLLSPHLTESDGAVRRFKREARAAAGLSASPHAVTIYDVGEHDGRPFIVMECLPGGTVADRLRSGERPSPADAVAWLSGTAEALDAAHEQEIVHRDVKPGNMLFDERGEVSLADFGIARVAYDPAMTMTGEILGTAAYLSPEQADSRPATAASDVYSLAVVAFELLTGTRPFSTGNFAATARMHIEAPPPRASERNEELSEDVDDILARGMAKDPDERWPSATAFAHALGRAVDALDEDVSETTVMPGRGAGADAGAAAGAGAGTLDEDEPALVERPRRRDPRAFRPRPPLGPPRPPARARAEDDEPSERRRKRPSAIVLLAALALALIAVGGIALLAGGGDDGTSSSDRADSAARAERDARAKRRAERRERAREKARLQGQTPATTAPAGQEDQPSGATPAPAESGTGGGAGGDGSSGGNAGGGDPAALNDQGFGLMNQGRYDEAIPVLQQAVSGCGNDVSELTCAYATFNLAKSLRLAGRPAEAIPLLERRLQNPDQRGEVEAELAQARSAAGDRGVDSGPGRGAGKPKKRSKPDKSRFQLGGGRDGGGRNNRRWGNRGDDD